MKLDKQAKYSKSHEWVRQEGDLYVYGITDHAQGELSDLVYIELPEVGQKFSQGEIVGVVELVKAASDLYLPIDGVVVEVNESLTDNPEIINSDPYGDGWIIKFRAADPTQIDELDVSRNLREFFRRRTMPYLPNTDNDIQSMLKTIGVSTVAELFDDVPAQFRFPELEISKGGL